MSTALHLALKEIWRGLGRFLLFSLVIALITLLILFIAALGEGLGAGNREYLEKLNGQLVAYQDTARLNIASSRIDCDVRRALSGIKGVEAVGGVGFSSVAIPRGGGDDPFDVSLIGVEPGKPGEPPVTKGNTLARRSADRVIVDKTVALVMNVDVGDTITVRSAQGADYEFYPLQVVGITSSQKYAIRPSIFVPIATWDKIRPKAAVGGGVDEPVCNVAAIRLQDPNQIEVMGQRLMERVRKVEVVDRKTAYENTPGYSAQQSTLTTQNTFALLIGLLVIGGFFQIQTLQKVPQIGMLKAIGTPNGVVAAAAMIQIILVTLLGVIVGTLIALGVALIFPPNIPIIFEPRSGATAVISILLIGPLGGLVSVRYSLRVEPLIALGLDT
ncbi:MAG: FtsX-like permease family protein [Anaerolineae bacterium]